MNNFDQSSTGVNLELDVSYDSCQASRDFENSFHVLQYSGHRQHSVLVFSQYGNFDVSDFDFTDLENWDLKSVTVKTLKAYLLQDLDYDFKEVFKLNKIEMLEEIQNYCPEDFQEFLEENLTPAFIKLTSRGHCQGDYSEVIIPKIVIDSYKGKTMGEVEELFSDNEIDNLLWNQPIYARLTIDNEDCDQFNFIEYVKDYYQYDKEEYLSIAKENITHEKKALIIEWLENNLPDQPEYDN